MDFQWPNFINMAPTLLFATNNEGRAYALSTGNSAWREFLYLGLEFKKLSAVPHFIWAIGGDRQVYLHVHSLDVPIRVCEVSYENERWYPGGWSQSLLPTDRPRFSTEDGLFDRDIQKITLPSLAWQWDGDWQLELTLENEPLNHDGWTYAVDFPRQYHSKMSTFTCVRRRKWIRFRKYCALNSWCAINPLHKDPTEEPFIDVCISGTNIESATGLMLVWAVTSLGRLMFRSGCSTTSPEGRKWIPVSTDCEVSQIAVGPSGMVWAACHNGRALVRLGVNRDNPQGKSWLEVKPPGNNLKLIQISVGTNSVWAITNDYHVWFRKGINGTTASISEDAAIGTGWIDMVGNMSSLSISANDQVFAVGAEDRNIYFRSGITSNGDLTGKKWKQIQCQMQMSRNSSSMSLSRRSSSGSPSRHRSLNSLKYQQQESQISIQEDEEEQSRSAPTANNRQKVELWEKPRQDSIIKEEMVENVASSCPLTNDVYEVSGRQLKNPRAWSPIRSVGSVVAVEAQSDSAVFESESGFSEDDFVGSQYWTECDVIWSNVTAGAVSIDPNQLPNWFSEVIDDSQTEMLKPWRVNILEKLKARNEKEKTGFDEYEKSVEASSWIKSGEVKMSRYNGTYEDCLTELEWVTSKAGMDCGTLTVLNSDGISTKMQFLLNEITCVMTCSEPGYSRLAIYSPRLPGSMSPLKLQFSGDSDLEDWLSHLSSVTARLNNVDGCPSNDSIWITNNLGEVFVTDPTILREQQQKAGSDLYTQEIDVSTTETPYLIKLPNGMPYGSYLKITGCVYDDADSIRFDLQSNATVRLRHKSEYFRNMPLHLNPRFHEKCIVFNSMEMSNWETEIRDSRMVFSPGKEFELIIKSETSGFRIIVDGKDYVIFKHRSQNPNTIVSMHCSGRVKLFKINYETTDVILSMNELFWRQMGGHLRKVETCGAGITWGIGYDHSLFSYTKGWGGFLKGLEISNAGINNMTDTYHYYIYENQRWNPISGFSTASLPTDRHTWSDITGRHKRSKEFNKLLSVHWQFVSDWLVDFHVPGGCDKEGWQYAVDFPMTYHAKKQFSDLVRRRRWYRKCRLNSKGPWQEVGSTKIIDVAIQSFNDTIVAWAISSAGDALFRKNVSATNNAGSSWEHVESDAPLISISCRPDNRIWVVTKNGAILFRRGITQSNLIGESWKRIDAPSNMQFKQVSSGIKGVWALDTQSRLAVRREISSSHPEGTHWQIIANIANDPPNLDSDGNIGYKCVSVGKVVMAISNSGYLCKRNGITNDNPCGTGWDIGIMGNWNYLCVNGY